jgi:predicted HAD superfamily Cof-like phosphohydrolase
MTAATDAVKEYVTSEDLVESVFKFNAIGTGVTPGRFHADRAAFYTGLECEELAEKLHAVAKGIVDVGASADLIDFAAKLDVLGNLFKAGHFRGAVLRAPRAELIDADIDLAIVSLGALMYTTSQFAEAIVEVLKANMAKFPNGVATRDANGKVIKPVGWVPPDIEQYVDSIID